MKNLVLISTLFLGFSSAVNAKIVCTNDNLVGEWTAKYILSSSAAVGTCTLVFNSNLVPSGSCDNFTDTESVNIFDGIGSISKSCSVKSKMLFDNGSKISTVTKMTADKQYMSGTFNVASGGKISKGKITFQKTGELSCEVTH